MITQLIDLFIEQGADWSYDFPIYGIDDLTGVTAAMMIRTVTGATFIATLTTANGGLTVDNVNQKITAKLTALQTSIFVPGSYVYDLKLKSSANAYYRSAQGDAIIDGQVTYIDTPAAGGIDITTEDGQPITTQSGTNITT